MTMLVIIHIAICVFLVFVILLQPGKSDGGIGFGGSSSQSIFGSKGAGNFLTKTTSVCAVVFLLTSFVLTRSRIREHNASVISGGGTEEAAKPIPSPVAPTTPNPAAGEAAKPAAPTQSPTK